MSEPSAAFRVALAALLARRELAEAEMEAVMNAIMAGACGEAEAAAFLVGLRVKGETERELAAAARVLRRHMVRWESGRDNVLDTCGTGGDGRGTFNISTAAAIVAAACGVPVVKHGNRAVSGATGSADVLRELGVDVDLDAHGCRRCLDRAGIAFCFAPRFHPALRRVADLRRRLGVPTLFNCLGPLANPAAAPYQLLGVGRAELLDLMAGALRHLDACRALVVHAEDGLDEVSLSAPTHVRLVVGGDVQSWVWTADDFGLEPCRLEELGASDAAASAAVIRDVLRGSDTPAARVVTANAAAALIAAAQVRTPHEGVERVRQALRSGAAAATLEGLVRASKEEAP